jgi:hypothetical protein
MGENQPDSGAAGGTTIRERVAKKTRPSRKKAGEGKKGEGKSASKRSSTRKSSAEDERRAPRRLSENELEILRERLRKKFH